MQRINFPKNYAIWLLLLTPILFRLPQLLDWVSADPLFFVGHAGDFARLPLGTPWIDPNVGYQAQALGKLSADLWLSGQVPWWNSFNGIGLPLAAEAQPASLFLPFVLLYHFRQGFLWLEIIFQIIAGLSTYALLRKLDLSKLASLTAGLLFELNGTFAWHGPPIISPIAFLPLLLLGIECLMARVEQFRYGGWWLITIALSCSIYSGFPETAYIDGLFASLWVLCRLPDIRQAQRYSLLGKLTLSVFSALLLSTPQIIPFAEYAMHSYLGSHAVSFSHASLPSAAPALSLAPWLYGPIFGFNDPWNAILMTWANIGGYFTALQVLLMLMAVSLAPRRLTLGLLAWMTVCLGKTFDIRPISDLVNILPLIKSVAFFRYAPPSWEFAGAVIIAFGINAIQRGEKIDYKRSAIAFIVSLLGSAFALMLAQRPVIYLLLQDKAHIYIYIALCWLLVSLMACVLCFKVRHHRLAYALACLLILDASLAFALPILGGARDTYQHKSGIAFLKANIGLQRAYSLGQMAPNYGGYFQIAQINHNYLPIYGDWVKYVNEHLDPAADPILFKGNTARIPGYGSAIDQLNGRLSAYEETGVKYLLVPSHLTPFASIDTLTIGGSSTRQAAMMLANDQGLVVRWDIPAARYARTLHGISIPIGNYAGKADGQLTAQICMAKDVCATAAGNLKDSVDNAPFNLHLDRDLLIPPSDNATFVPLAIQFVHNQATQPVAIWMADVDAFQTGNVSLEGMHTNKAPAFSLVFTSTEKIAEPSRVYTGPDMAIYELPESKPYFEVLEGQCSLHPQSRTHIQLQCSTPAKLLRREAFYPGWTASEDETPVPLERAHELFQVITISSGSHLVTYSYRPTYYGFIVLSFLSGILLMLYGARKEFRYLHIFGRRDTYIPRQLDQLP